MVLQRVEFDVQVAGTILDAWHRQWIDEDHPGTESLHWMEDKDFAQARLLGVAHTTYVVPCPPFFGDGPQGYAIIDWPDEPLEGPPNDVKITKTYNGYNAALRVASDDIADENEVETSVR